MYGILDYGKMAADKVRTGAYLSAMRKAIRPDSVVVDIGTGTGLLAVMACRMGARRVYAIELEDVIQVAQRIAAANGCADRIIFLRESSMQAELPERADVVVSDLHGVLPLYKSHIPSIADARKRLLAAGGKLIPQRETVLLVPAEAPDTYEKSVGCCAAPGWGLDMELARVMAANQWSKTRITPSQMLARPQLWAELDYRTIESPNVGGRHTWIILREGTIHGFVSWFDTELFEGVAFSNGPEAPQALYGSAFFPLQEPVTLSKGDAVALRLEAVLAGDEYVWRWDTVVTATDGTAKASFKQSTLLSVPLDARKLRRRADAFRPALSERGEADAFVLSRMNGSTTLAEIAIELAQRFPRLFATREDALKHAAQISERYAADEPTQ